MVKLSDVAEAAGVSVTTASLILNPGKQVCRASEECIVRVKAVAQKLGYVGNYHARAIHMGRAESLGLALDAGTFGSAMGNVHGPYFANLTGGVESRTHAVGYNLAIIGPGKDELASDRGLRQVRQRRMDGLVVAGVLSDVRRSRMIQEEPELPVVLVEYDEKTQLPVVTYDEAGGVDQAVGYLAELGHRHILWLGPRGDHPERREKMFLTAIQAAGVQSSSCFFERLNHAPDRDVTADAAQEALSRELGANAKRTATAVVCYNDQTAIGAYGAIMKAGLNIPADMSVIGYDNFYAQCVFPRLSTIDHVMFEMGSRAAELVLEMAGSKTSMERLRGYVEAVPTRLIVRDSTAAPASR